ncbi:MAG: flippase-like domain-containing protein [Acidobacteria bacterium]|nr:flippase-like domain-containing protein [Acidobacteriota bacterium]
MRAKLLRVILAFLLGGVSLYFAMRGVAIDEAWKVMRELRWGYLTAAIGLVLISPLVRAWRWRELFGEEPPGLPPLVGAIAMGQTLNFLAPLRSGEVARVLMVGGRKLEVAGTIAVEKFLDIALFAAICLLLPLVWVLPGWLKGTQVSLMFMAVAYLAVVVTLTVVLPRTTRLPQIVRIPRIEKVPLLVGASILLWLSSVSVNYFVLRALQVQASFLAAVVVLVVLQAGVSVPSTPGKVGVFQYLAVLGLSLFGVAKARALAFGLTLHLIVFLPVALMAVIFWASNSRTSRRSP